MTSRYATLINQPTTIKTEFNRILLSIIRIDPIKIWPGLTFLRVRRAPEAPQPQPRARVSLAFRASGAGAGANIGAFQ